MNKIDIISWLITILGIGLIKVIYEHSAFRNKLKFFKQFKVKFSEFAYKKNFDQEIFKWLNLNSIKAQKSMGVYGLIVFGGVDDYPVVINTLSILHKAKTEPLGMSRMDKELAKMCEDVVERYIGVLIDQEKDIFTKILYPWEWLFMGINTLIKTPAYILHRVGLIKLNTYKKSSESKLFKIINLIAAVATIIGAIFTILSYIKQ